MGWIDDLGNWFEKPSNAGPLISLGVLLALAKPVAQGIVQAQEDYDAKHQKPVLHDMPPQPGSTNNK